MTDSSGEDRREAEAPAQATQPSQGEKSQGDGGGQKSGSRRRRRGSRGGRNRNRGGGAQREGAQREGAQREGAQRQKAAGGGNGGGGGNQPKAETSSGRKPKIGDSMPAPPASAEASPRRDGQQDRPSQGGSRRRRRRRGGRGRGGQAKPVEAVTVDTPIELDEETLERRRGRARKGKPVGRYLMLVHVRPHATQISVLEGRNLIEHYVSRPADDVFEIHGNIYLARVQNVLPGMEAAFVDIGTPKNAVLYRGDVVYDTDDVEERDPKIEQLLKAQQTIVCQVTKNPIGHKGARLTQEVSLPGRFVVLVPNSRTYGISKRLPDKERKRLRQILDKVKAPEHGVIVRTAAESVTAEEIERDVARLMEQWTQIEALAKRSKAPQLLYREPELAVRVIREEFSKDYRGVIIDDKRLYDEVRDYAASITPALADRLQHYDTDKEPLALFERYHVHEQLAKGLDKKVWLPSGGSLIVEQTEALTVIDVNTGKNVGSSSLEETVYKNNVEAAREVAKQLRLRDIGGIIVIDFVDMEDRKNRDEVMRVFREALSRDKTRTQVFDISELGLVEMTRKRIGEGLVESFSHRCDQCEGRGLLLHTELLEDAKGRR